MHRTQCKSFENSLLSRLFLIMSYFRLINQSVLRSLSVRSERVWCSGSAIRRRTFRSYGLRTEGFESVLAGSGTDRPTLAWLRTCKRQKPARTGFGTEPSLLQTRVYVHGFRMLQNSVLSAKSTKNTKLNRVRKFLRLQYIGEQWSVGHFPTELCIELLHIYCK